MTKSIASYPEERRRTVIMRRINSKGDRGAGYWAAKAAAEKLGLIADNTNKGFTRKKALTGGREGENNHVSYGKKTIRAINRSNRPRVTRRQETRI